MTLQLVTATDAQTALLQVQNDIVDVLAKLNARTQDSSSFLGWAYTDDLTGSSLALINQLQTYANQIDAEVATMRPLDELTPQIIAQLKELQKEVIDDRASVNDVISDVDWTFGGIFDDATTQIENWGSQAVSAVSGSLGINWTYVAIALGAIVIFLIWRKVT